jgi:hypothetical protein
MAKTRSSTETDQSTQNGEAQEPSEEEIARRAYEIHESGEGGSPADDWERARRELSEAARRARGDAAKKG